MREKRKEESETERGGAAEGGRGPTDKGIKKDDRQADKQTNNDETRRQSG